jgi:hypothetical protein
MDKPKCSSERTEQVLASALAGCTEEEARALLWEAARRINLDPVELLGIDADEPA